LKHDIRFVEDNWEQPAIGAWGLGWEVWLDGQEITQFTYFQQAGGINIDPVSVELTYGLDRIAIALQRVSGFQEIQWNSLPDESVLEQRTFSAGDVNLQAEREHSRYYFEVADISRLREMYELYEAEAKLALEQDLILPAYDYLLKCSHTFNVLDTRGAVGVTERQAFFGRMREVARKISAAYLDERQRLEFPWLPEDEDGRARNAVTEADKILAEHGDRKPAAFLLEIGTEELPAADLSRALEQLEIGVPRLLEDQRISHGDIKVMGTPRRLVVNVEDLAPAQPDEEQVIKGPPAERAFDDQGQPTPAAQGFAGSKGVHVGDLQVRELDGGKYVVAVVQSKGKPSVQVLSEELPNLVAGLRFVKSMRWNSSNLAFSRPIRWMLAMWGEQVIPFAYAGVSSGNTTRGLRFLTPSEFEVHNPAGYYSGIELQGIVLDPEERAAQIRSQVESLASDAGGQAVIEAELLAEVTNLVEAALGVRGAFDPQHLDLPREVLISVMKKHQRYFPVEKEGKLLPYFIAVTNRGEADRSQELDLIIEGNEHVIQARFADAAFFVKEDASQPLEDYLPKLDTLMFQKDLGSVLDKTRRIHDLVAEIAAQLGLTAAQVETGQRAAELCKADLVTQMVVEMTSLQGTMGRYYALNSGEKAEVADAIFEHYLPRFAGDDAPASMPGLVVGLADRLDTLAGLFSVGLAPSGTKDPFGQRRAALGVVGNLMELNLDFDLREALQAAARYLPGGLGQEVLEECLQFIVDRQRNLLLDMGKPFDIVDAVLTAQGHNPNRAAEAVDDLNSWVERDDWGKILPTYSRCVRITRDLDEKYPVDERLFKEEAEKALYSALLTAEEEERDLGSVDDFLNAFSPLMPYIDGFFDQVLVMVDEKEVRENRLGLLQRIADLALGAADMSKLEGF
jgi:glycyl-tRNA synthetase